MPAQLFLGYANLDTTRFFRTLAGTMGSGIEHGASRENGHAADMERIQGKSAAAFN
jgi:hypothetical protein